MSDPNAIPSATFPRWGKIRDVLAVLAAIRDIREPLGSAEGLRQSLALLIQLAEVVGVEPAWTGKLRSILEEPGVFAIVLALVQYVLGTAPKAASDDCIRMGAADGDVTLHAADFAQWLPLVVQLIQLLRQIRGSK